MKIKIYNKIKKHIIITYEIYNQNKILYNMNTKQIIKISIFVAFQQP